MIALPSDIGSITSLSCMTFAWSELVSFHNEKIGELPWIGQVELGLIVSAEDVGVVLQRVPVRRV
ncbi:hypothetical protein NSPZN2_50049 [Nitrospira defluvii]|uniref:Uncharacterized protein n=1 Tax=Nitrospira defluvii TaxID=330214 RepID=A0ABM8S200_9BACT|nr:hypothetical protein NSPZN2_50049 [Nitrospira defluvii]